MKSTSKPRKTLRAAAAPPPGSQPERIRITRNVPTLSVGAITLRASATEEVPKLRLLGLPRSGFAFTPEERAAIERAAPSMPNVDRPNKIPIIDVKLAYLVEDYIERVKEATHEFGIKETSRELGAIANPGKGRPRAAADLSEPVIHLLATQLLLRGGTSHLDKRNITAKVEAIRKGGYTAEELQIAAREVRTLGGMSVNRSWAPGTTTNGPLWSLGSHVLEEWEFGMKLPLRLSQDLDRDDGAHEGTHSEVVRLTQVLQEIGIRRLWDDGIVDVDFNARAEVYWVLLRVRDARQSSSTGNAFHAPKRRSEDAATHADEALKRLSKQVADARKAAHDWVERGVSRRRRPRSAQ